MGTDLVRSQSDLAASINDACVKDAAHQKSRIPKPRRSDKKASTRKAKASKHRKKARTEKVVKKTANKASAKRERGKVQKDSVELEQAEQDQLQAFLNYEEGQLVAGDPGLTPRQRKKRTKGLPEVENLRVLALTCPVENFIGLPIRRA